MKARNASPALFVEIWTSDLRTLELLTFPYLRNHTVCCIGFAANSRAHSLTSEYLPPSGSARVVTQVCCRLALFAVNKCVFFSHKSGSVAFEPWKSEHVPLSGFPPLYSLLSTLYSVLSTLYSLLSTLYTLLSTLYYTYTYGHFPPSYTHV